MKGYLEKRGKNSWRLTVELPRGLDGQRLRRRITVQGTKPDAQNALNKLLAEVQSGISIDPSKLTLGKYLIEKWLPIKIKSISPKSAERYTEVITKHIVPALGHIPIAKLRPMHIQTHYQKELESGRKNGKGGGLTPQSVQFHHAVLHNALSAAVKWELITRNPADSVTLPKSDKHQATVLSAHETIQLLLCAQGTAYYIPTLLAVTTGMRRGEICALRWEDVDLDAGTLAVRRTLQQTRDGLYFRKPKSSSSIRVIALLPMTVKALKEHKGKQEIQKTKVQELGLWNDNDLIYCKNNGKPYLPNSLTRCFHVVFEAAGIKYLRFHDLRHTHATLLLEQGVHPKVVQERLGHASITMTMDLYSHVMPTVQRDAANQLEKVLKLANVPKMSPTDHETEVSG